MMSPAYLLVSKTGFMKSAYMIGTRAECARYALLNGLRASTEIIPF